VLFSGFEPDDFELFSIPEFPARMAAIRGTLRPKLAALGEDLQGPLEAATGIPTCAHVAQHMRRRVNPPAETWVAFGRDRKGYKRWTHYRVAVSGEGVRVTVFVEDDADDKPQLARSLRENGAAILGELAAAPVLWYTLDGDAPVPQARVDRAAIERLAVSLERKTTKFQAGVPLPREQALALTPADFEAWALDQARHLRPLYLAGASSA
jgi:uncharacterized protein YktB (UPF0637 family)